MASVQATIEDRPFSLEKEAALIRIVFLFLSPILLIFPGLYPARLVCGPGFSARMLAWSAFFSIVLLPPLSFGLAMLLGTTVKPSLVFPLAGVMGLAGLLLPRRGVSN